MFLTKNKTIEFVSSNIEIDSIEIYDLPGKSLFQKKLINDKKATVDNISNSTILLIKVTMIDGSFEFKNYLTINLFEAKIY